MQTNCLDRSFYISIGVDNDFDDKPYEMEMTV